MGIQVSEEEFEKAGGDPLKIPKLAEALGKIPEIIEEEERQKVESQHLGDAQEMMTGGEALVFPVIAGVQVIRDITAGVFNLLNKMQSPIVTGEEIEDDNEWLEHICFLLFLMSYEDERQLVRWFAQGKDILWQEFMVWSFSEVDLSALMKDQGFLNDALNSVSQASEEGSTEEEENSSVPKCGG